LSSAILYLAIVAIWAGVLIPRWLKRDTAQVQKSSTEFVGGPPARANHDVTDGADGDMTESDTDAGPVGDTAGDTPRRGEDTREYETPRARPAPEIMNDDPGESRARILSARRRMLMILCTLTVAALGIAVIHLAAWWVTIPPILMLGGYLMLLREASRADAEHVLLQAAAYQDEQDRRRVAYEAREAEARRAEEERRVAAEAAAAEAEHARVIDISGRVRDELYDQYADAERRAVGD
jgi:hypothetical protein